MSKDLFIPNGPHPVIFLLARKFYIHKGSNMTVWTDINSTRYELRSNYKVNFDSVLSCNIPNHS